MTNSTKLAAVTPLVKHRLKLAMSTLYQLQPTIKAQRQFYSRWLQIYSRHQRIEFYVKTPQYLTRLEKLLRAKKLSALEKLDLAGILETSGWYIKEFCDVAQNKEGYTEAKVDLFCKCLMVTPEDNMRFCENLRAIITLQQDKILSERLQLLV